MIIELIKAQKEYIEFLTDMYNEVFGQAALHGYQCKSEYVLKGFVMRKKIEDLENKKRDMIRELTHLIKCNPRKHIRAAKDTEGYRFCIFYLIEIENLAKYLNDRYQLYYKRNKVAIVFKDFYFSKESINSMFKYSEQFK